MKRLIIAAATLFAAACQPMPVDGGRAEFAEAPATPGAGEQEPPAVRDIDTTDVPPAVQVPERSEASACAARGGKMLPQGRMQSLQCVVTYADAGQRCTDGDDCQGDCRIEETNAGGFPAAGAAAVGQCQRVSGRFGCYTLVEDGKAQATLCVD